MSVNHFLATGNTVANAANAKTLLKLPSGFVNSTPSGLFRTDFVLDYEIDTANNCKVSYVFGFNWSLPKYRDLVTGLE